MEFIEILEEQIRRKIVADVRAEFEAKLPRPNATQHPAAGRELTETWLIAHTPKSHFERGHAGRRAYNVQRPATPPKRPARAITPPPREPRVALDSPEAVLAFELLARAGGATCVTNITESELKSLWRRAALKAHPDRHATANPEEQRRQCALFRELTEAYASLLKLF